MGLDGDRIRYQTYNDVQSINAGRRDMWTVIAEAVREADRRRAEAAEASPSEAPAEPSSAPSRGRNER